MFSYLNTRTLTLSGIIVAFCIMSSCTKRLEDIQSQSPSIVDSKGNKAFKSFYEARIGWESLGGAYMAGSPAAVSSNSGNIDVFARGQADDALWQWHGVLEDGIVRYGVANLEGHLFSDPTVCSWGGGRLDVFVRGEDNALLWKTYDNTGGWNEWEPLDGYLTSNPTAASWVTAE